jgi:hypothetical protein
VATLIRVPEAPVGSFKAVGEAVGTERGAVSGKTILDHSTALGPSS